MNRDYNNNRKQYKYAELGEENAPENPWELFQQWHSEAQAEFGEDADAFVLSSCGANGQPSSRVVLMKSFVNEQIVFFTNYQSRKAIEFEQNNKVSLVFLWIHHDRQIRLEGRIEKLPSEQSDIYYANRPRSSQIGAWISPQSKVVESRSVLMQSYKAQEEKFEGCEIQRPDFWGGYLINIDAIEFWQGRQDRLNDRFLYQKNESSWKKHRLAP